jgi:CRISPR-associated protein Cas5t
MEVLRVELDGVTTSFRFPHFLVGRQPTFPLPPPATILGHIASALGEYPDHRALRFAYSFTAAGRVDDVETAHITEVGGAVPREDKGRFPYPVNVTATPGPLLRELLVQPHLVLYLDAPGELERFYRAFREPRYMVVLGRSQDLASYRRVEVIQTELRPAGYVEGTLLPQTERPRFRAAVPMIMPRYIDPDNRRRVDWQSYLVLTAHCFVTPDVDGENANRARARAGETFDVDPQSPARRDRQGNVYQRILYWHRFVDAGV